MTTLSLYRDADAKTDFVLPFEYYKHVTFSDTVKEIEHLSDEKLLEHRIKTATEFIDHEAVLREYGLLA